MRPLAWGHTHCASFLATDGEAVLPARSIVAVRRESRRILSLGARGARAAVRVALAIGERKAREVDVGRRRLDVRWRDRRWLGWGRAAIAWADARADRGRRASTEQHAQNRCEKERTRVRDGKGGHGNQCTINGVKL